MPWGATEDTLLAAAGAQFGGGAHNVFVLMQKREIINCPLSLGGTGVGTIFILTGQVSGTPQRGLQWRCAGHILSAPGGDALIL